LFPDGSGNTISWMILPIIGQQWENIAQYNWGSAKLAWLYRQLCDACQWVASNSNLGGRAYISIANLDFGEVSSRTAIPWWSRGTYYDV
jgi:hypothetical protein